MGKWLPILSRVVTKTVFGDDPDRHWNVVQNNGMCFSSFLLLFLYNTRKGACLHSWNPKLLGAVRGVILVN